MLQIKKDYESANKYMMDYRMNLLSTFIESKLGLKKKNTKGESLINSLIYDISKEYISKNKE